MRPVIIQIPEAPKRPFISYEACGESDAIIDLHEVRSIEAYFIEVDYFIQELNIILEYYKDAR